MQGVRRGRESGRSAVGPVGGVGGACGECGGRLAVAGRNSLRRRRRGSAGVAVGVAMAVAMAVQAWARSQHRAAAGEAAVATGVGGEVGRQAGRRADRRAGGQATRNTQQAAWAAGTGAASWWATASSRQTGGPKGNIDRRVCGVRCGAERDKRRQARCEEEGRATFQSSANFSVLYLSL